MTTTPIRCGRSSTICAPGPPPATEPAAETAVGTAAEPIAGAVRTFLFGILLGAAAALAGCAGGPSPHPLPTAGIPPWEIPAGAFGSQRLYRVSYSGPEGEGSFRVTLRLVAVDHYQVQAVDPVGRSLWSLDVSGGRGLSLNHRARTFCAFEGSFDLSGVSLGPFPLLSLPAMLLGRVPAVPAEPPQEEKGGISFHDGSGRRWSATVGAQGVVESWTLWEDGGPAAWWIVRDNWSILSERSRGRQVRWREVLREALTTPPAPLQKPTGFREECEAPALEDGAGGTPPPPG